MSSSKSWLPLTWVREEESPAKAGLVPLGRRNLLGGELPVAIDSRKCLSMVAAAKFEGLGCGAVDRSALTGIKANSNAGWIGFDFVYIPNHGLNVALTIARLEEGQ